MDTRPLLFETCIATDVIEMLVSINDASNGQLHRDDGVD